ncbi:MAG: hypothetical protein FJX76_12050 [Armatimonadetes bacterium]|nr:hypothetical protein [Armatimonadota bacterium]
MATTTSAPRRAPHPRQRRGLLRRPVSCHCGRLRERRNPRRHQPRSAARDVRRPDRLRRRLRPGRQRRRRRGVRAGLGGLRKLPLRGPRDGNRRQQPARPGHHRRHRRVGHQRQRRDRQADRAFPFWR